MYELGQLLKKARLERGISLDDLQESTKIRKRYLEAIEEGNYKILPGNFYVRAFVKSYAEAVGLDPSEVLSIYRNVIPAAVPEASTEPLRRVRSTPKAGINWGRWSTGIMLWSFIILIIAVLYYFLVHYQRDSGTTQPQSEVNRLTDKTASPTASGSAAKKSPSPSATPSATPTPTPTPTPVVNVKLDRSNLGIDYYIIDQAPNISIDMKILNDASWVAVTNMTTKQNLQYAEMPPGTVKNFTLNQPVSITLGRANAVELKVNGVPIPVGDQPNAKRFQFNLAGAPAP